ncbi:MAG: ABC transporter ATP-binding protein [Acidobacteria bacterium]|nr:ABC transporter ATP-binding protein [Acidobacteriota bacterium]
MIEVRGLTKKFGAVTAVDGLTLRVERGEVFGLVGPDGAGKTTVMRMLCTLVAPTSGEARVAGFDVTREVDQVKDRIGYMAQRFGLYGDLTVAENMRFYADLFGVEGEAALTEQLLEMTRMAPFRDRYAAQLSGGMKQKLALMCTLLHKPEILFLDEPTNGVDPVSRRDFWVILRRLVDGGLTVFLTTAYLDEAERCGRVGLMHGGRLIRVDTPAGLKQALPEACIEVRCGDPRAARALLRGMDGIASADLTGSALHVFVRPGGPDEEAVRAYLAGRGISDAQARRILPSLEDVFIATIRGEAAVHAG